jgi:hypothetical protein
MSTESKALIITLSAFVFALFAALIASVFGLGTTKNSSNLAAVYAPLSSKEASETGETVLESKKSVKASEAEAEKLLLAESDLPEYTPPANTNEKN